MFSGEREYLESIAHSPVVPAQWQLETLALVGLNSDLYFYTPGVTPEDLGAYGDRWFRTAPGAVNAVLDGLPQNARIALIPEGPYAYARVTEGSA